MTSRPQHDIHQATDINVFNDDVIADFRANGGQVGGYFATLPLMLLTHTGAKTGVRRTSPLAYALDAGRVVIVASKAGLPTHPHWYLNLLANPDVTVELPGETFEARAVVTAGEERARLFRLMVDRIPNFEKYQAKTERTIPVVVLERI